MAKKENLCGRAHGLLDELFGCDRCKKERKRQERSKKNQAIHHANDQSATFEGWRIGSDWSRSRRRQFPRGLPPDD